MSKARFLAS